MSARRRKALIPAPTYFAGIDFDADRPMYITGAPKAFRNKVLIGNGGTYCAICHGGGAVANAMAPDLRASAVPLDSAAFGEVVRAGARVNRGMPPFSGLTDEELDALRHYVRAVAHRDARVARLRRGTAAAH